ncbi:hypothetical protein CDL15_Pgr015254 [Punica granatum]|uniref:DC1 domain-containing protein n=2 Tax=Punica granatum TaxID=22663 RepID=A0A218VZY5_PUNGR|nr:hypothetical protein CDL15_Pgr015254 [Punica granatum]
MDSECKSAASPTTEMQIHHSLHLQHPLSIYNDCNGLSLFDEEPICKLCGCKCYGPSHGCVQCKFFLHKLCARLPAEFPCPIHPSQALKRHDEYREFECGSCSSTSFGFPYRCDSCGFNLDFGCVFFQEVNQDLYQIGRYDGIKCLFCANSCAGAVIACPDNEFFLHKSCYALPKQIQHPSHPFHPLRKLEYALQFKCNGCLLDQDNRAAYTCMDPSCMYSLDFDCAFLFEGCQLLHLDAHPHLLASTEKKQEDKLCCVVCHESCSGPTYSCLICKFHLHMSCIALEEIPNHPSHPFHRLMRTTEQRKFKCHACLKDNNSRPYRWEDCDFDLDFDCAFVVPHQEFEGKEPILSDIHRHPLALSGQRSKKDGKESCATASIPKDIEHRLFQGHSLQMSLGKFECSICLKDRSGIHYGCSDQACEVKLDVQCALDVDRSLITFDGHNHPLIFLENFEDYAKCSACNKYNKSHSIFHCPACNFKLHLLCGPLPCYLKQEKHLEMLVLKDTHIGDWVVDEFYCDSCEELRDPRECVYYCERCNYSAEVKCIMPELVLALMGKSGDVELRTLGRWPLSGKVASRGLSAEEIHKCDAGEVPKKTAVTLGCILESFTEGEKNELDVIFDCKEKLFEDLGGGGDTILDASLGSNEDFMQLVARLDSTGLALLKKKWDADIPFIKVGKGDNLLPEKLVRVYNDLYHAYGDPGAESGLSPQLKSIFFLHLCQTVESMWATTVLDITEEGLVDWWISVKAVRRAGFKTCFVADALKVAMHAYFGIRAKTFEDNLTHEIELLEEKIREKKASQGGIEYLESRRSSTVRECMSEAPPLMYKTASEVVLGLG